MKVIMPQNLGGPMFKFTIVFALILPPIAFAWGPEGTYCFINHRPACTKQSPCSRESVNNLKATNRPEYWDATVVTIRDNTPTWYDNNYGRHYSVGKSGRFY